MNESKTTGSCLCAAVTYEITGDPMFTGHCCCIDCQKASGADHITLTFYTDDQLKISGEIAEYGVVADSGNTNYRQFCPKCGSRLFSRNSAREGVRGVHAGTMDNPKNIKPSRVLYTKDQRPWDHFDKDLPCFEQMPPPPPPKES